MTTAQNKTDINYQAFTMNVSKRDALNFAFPKKSGLAGATIGIAATFSLIPLLFVVLVTTLLTPSAIVTILIFVGYLCWVALVIGAAYSFTVDAGIDEMRLRRFAQDNNFVYKESITASETGIFANAGDNQQYHDHFDAVVNGKSITISNFSYSTGSGENRTQYIVGIVELTLPRSLPNILLDSKSNNYIDGVGNFISHNQKLSLEGDFDKYFTLYTPDNYERDSLYFLTPELMELLIKEGQNYDIEVVDNKLKLYIQGGLAFNEQNFRLLFAVVDSLGGEFIENTHNYVDTASATKGTVAVKGQRLKKNNWPTITGIIGALIFVLIVIFQIYYSNFIFH